MLRSDRHVKPRAIRMIGDERLEHMSGSFIASVKDVILFEAVVSYRGAGWVSDDCNCKYFVARLPSEFAVGLPSL